MAAYTPFGDGHAQPGGFTRLQDAFLQMDAYSGMEDLQFADVQRRAPCVGDGDVCLGFALPLQQMAQVEFMGREAGDGCVLQFSLGQAGEIGQQHGRERQFVLLAHFVAREARQVDGGLRQSQVGQLFCVERQDDGPLLARLKNRRTGFCLQVGGQVHQDGFVGQGRLVGNTQVQDRILSTVSIGEVKRLHAEADLPDGVRVGLREVFQLAHHLSVQVEIDHVGLGIGKDGY